MSSVTGMHHYLLPFVIPGPHIQRHWVEWAAWQEWVLFTSFWYSLTPYTGTFSRMSSVTGMCHYLLPFVIPGPHIQRHLGRMSSVTGMGHYLLPFLIPGPHIQGHLGRMSSMTGMGNYLLPFFIPGPHIQRHWGRMTGMGNHLLPFDIPGPHIQGHLAEWAAWQECVIIYFLLLFLDPIYSDIG